MVACEECLGASLARAGAIKSLEMDSSIAGGLRQQLEDAGGEGSVSADDFEMVRLRKRCAELGVWMLCHHEPRYPQRLLRFRRPSDVPSVLYGLGNLERLVDLAERPGVAIVGARRASAYGREVSYNLARSCSGVGIGVISGMALGIDGAAHRGALSGHGSTIAVLAGGAELAYPRSHRLLHEQIIAGGCVVSEAPPGSVAQRWGFVARNRIIAGLSSMTVLVEGTLGSGARHTIAFADELDVAVGAVPGPITSPMSAGPNALLGGEGVVCVRGIEDITRVLELETFDHQKTVLSTVSEEVLRAVRGGAGDLRELAAKIDGLESREILRLLGELELAGRVRRAQAGRYVAVGT